VTRFTDDALTLPGDVDAGPDGHLWFSNFGGGTTGSSLGRIVVTPSIATALNVTTPPTLPCANARDRYETTLTAAGGTLPYKWRKLSTLPRGLKLRAKTGILEGVPKTAGTYTFTLRVKDSHRPRPKAIATRTFTLVVR
jgi:hypothetical protein